MNNAFLPDEQQLCAARILIIDDEDTYVQAVDWFLRQAKFRNLRGLTKSAEALEEFRKFKPDLVILDLHMPELDGFTLLRQLRGAILLGESDVRRFSDIIEAGSTAGWHTFEYSLVKAYEEELITEETAML